jgi:hypothetical protein
MKAIWYDSFETSTETINVAETDMFVRRSQTMTAIPYRNLWKATVFGDCSGDDRRQ